MTEPQEKSVTFTVIVLFGILVAAVGLVMTILGLGGSTAFELSIGEWVAKTTSTGLAVMVIGCTLSAGVALKKPKDVRLFGPDEAPRTDRIRTLGPPLALTALLCLVLLVISIVVS